MLTLITPPAEEPVSLAEARLHLRVESTAEDALITSLIAAARQVCETHTKRALVTQTWDLSLDAWPGSYRGVANGWRRAGIETPLPPLQSVTSIAYLDTVGDTQTLATSGYTVQAGTPGRIYLAHGEGWPAIRCYPGAITVRFVAGYGDASAVPECVKAAMKLLVGHWYENREVVLAGQGVFALPLPYTVDLLLSAESWGYYG